VLKKMVIVSSVAAVAMLGAAGMAWAEDAGDGSGSTNCTSDDIQHQSNKGHQLVGGNLSAQDVTTNVLGAQGTRPAGICPSVANNNHL
jgi:hypothetical protein